MKKQRDKARGRDEEIASLQQSLKHIQTEKEQLEAALEDSKKKFQSLEKGFAKQLAEMGDLHRFEVCQTEDLHLFELSQIKKTSVMELSQYKELFERKLFRETQMLKAQTEKRLKQLVSDRNELSMRYVHLEEKVAQKEKEQTEEIQHIQEENIKLQAALEDSKQVCDTMNKNIQQLVEIDQCQKHQPFQIEELFRNQHSGQAEKFQKDLSGNHQNQYVSEKELELQQAALEDSGQKKEVLTKLGAKKDKCHLLEIDQREQSLMGQLSYQAEKFQKQFFDLKKEFMSEPTEREKHSDESLCKRNEPSESCAKWEAKVAELEEKTKKLQQPMEEYAQLQAALEDSKQICDAKNKNIQQLVEIKTRQDKFQLFKTEELFRRQLSEQTEKFQKDLSENHQNQEQELQQVMKEKDQLQRAVAESKHMCFAMKKKMQQLMEKDEHRQFQILHREEMCMEQLSEQAETFRKDLSKRFVILKTCISEKQQQLQQDMEKNTPQKKTKTKKEGFWNSIFISKSTN